MRALGDQANGQEDHSGCSVSGLWLEQVCPVYFTIWASSKVKHVEDAW